MKIYKSILLIILLTAGGCSLLNRQPEVIQTYSAASVQQLVLRAISGDTTINAKLNNLVDLNIPVNNDYNSLVVDSLVTKSRKKFFVVLLGYPNPIYNRLAVYDTALNNYLLDKSLNGYLNEDILSLNDRKLVKVSESFLSKDVLQLKRISLYEIKDNSSDLCFRTFTKLVESPSVYTQKISGFSSDQITTDLSGPKNSPIDGMKDVFIYNYAKNKYISQGNVFDNFIEQQIKNYKSIFEKPEITDKKSYYGSVGIDIDVDTIKNTGNTKNNEGYTLTLTENWKTVRNISISDFLKSPLRGIKYINDVIGASISVIPLPEGTTAENYTNISLADSKSGKYRVRSSEKIISKNDFVQLFEFSCGAKTYLLILSASRYTYDQYIKDLTDIISSFTINC